MNVYAKFSCALLHIKKALGIYRELITTTTTTTTRVAFWDPPDPPSGSNKKLHKLDIQELKKTMKVLY